ncbi:MAG: hypothetical protein A2Y73_05910 [Chloroflexi bacterium RBG_13_56_8]|nr:MAG: hypothetical protein A2Y73_05910 [Chloroflexi bacterium RBG_13_56_8]
MLYALLVYLRICYLAATDIRPHCAMMSYTFGDIPELKIYAFEGDSEIMHRVADVKIWAIKESDFSFRGEQDVLGHRHDLTLHENRPSPWANCREQVVSVSSLLDLVDKLDTEQLSARKAITPSNLAIYEQPAASFDPPEFVRKRTLRRIPRLIRRDGPRLPTHD